MLTKLARIADSAGYCRDIACCMESVHKVVARDYWNASHLGRSNQVAVAGIFVAGIRDH